MWKVRILHQRKSNEKRRISASISYRWTVAVSFRIMFEAYGFTCNKSNLSWDMKCYFQDIFLQLSGR